MKRILRPITRLIMAGILLAPIASHAGLVLENGLTEEKTVQPGDVYEGAIPIRNTGQAPVEVKLYQTDYAFSADGSNDYGKPGGLPRSNASWLSLNQEQVTIPAGGQAIIGYTVQVPADAALSGTYWSMVMVEPIAQGSPEATGSRPDEVRAQLAQIMRYGIQMVNHIDASGSRDLAFENLKLLNKDGRRLFSVDLKNTGQRWLRLQLSVELFEPSGQPAHKLDGEKKRLYPDTSARFQVDLGDVASGKYIALIVADGGGEDLFGAQVELDLQ